MLTSLKNLIRVWIYIGLNKLDPNRYPKPGNVQFNQSLWNNWDELEAEVKGVFGEMWDKGGTDASFNPMGLRENVEFWRLVQYWKTRNPIIHEKIMLEYKRFNACVSDPSLDSEYYKKHKSVVTITYNGEVRVERVDSAQHMLVWMESQGL